MSAATLQLTSRINTRFDIPLGIRLSDPSRTPIPTGIPALDRLTDGGILPGTLTEISGQPSTGRSTFLFSLLSQATQRGEYCAWIDASGSFDPASAAQAGVLLQSVLWINCAGSTEHALKATDLLIQAGGFGIVVLDLADTPEREARRISLASWFRLRQAAAKAGSALLVMEREINARSCSTLQIEMQRKRAVWTGKLLKGVDVEADSRKHYRSRTADFLAIS